VTIEVIVRGTPPQAKFYKCECSSCKSVLMFQRSDLHVTDDGRNGQDMSIKCPVCSSLQYLHKALESYEVQITRIKPPLPRWVYDVFPGATEDEIRAKLDDFVRKRAQL